MTLCTSNSRKGWMSLVQNPAQYFEVWRYDEYEKTCIRRASSRELFVRIPLFSLPKLHGPFPFDFLSKKRQDLNLRNVPQAHTSKAISYQVYSPERSERSCKYSPTLPMVASTSDSWLQEERRNKKKRGLCMKAGWDSMKTIAWMGWFIHTTYFMVCFEQVYKPKSSASLLLADSDRSAWLQRKKLGWRANNKYLYPASKWMVEYPYHLTILGNIATYGWERTRRRRTFVYQ